MNLRHLFSCPCRCEKCAADRDRRMFQLMQQADAYIECRRLLQARQLADVLRFPTERTRPKGAL